MDTISAHDVAAYILQEYRHPITTWKLQKLVYYCQAWSLVWDEKPLFHEKIEAWVNGPVVRELYNGHRELFTVDEWKDGDPDELNEDQKETVDSVLEYYGGLTGQQLSDLTHREQPWRRARKGLDPGERGTRKIILASLDEYYSSIQD
jgi:uncharacterized phage-associated protein